LPFLERASLFAMFLALEAIVTRLYDSRQYRALSVESGTRKVARSPPISGGRGR
jgi:hypothetical protein